MRRTLLGSIFLVVLSTLFLAFFSGKANAIPAFARKYKTSCALCHAPFSRLTAMEESFRLNGYKLPEADELYVKEQPVSMGVEAYKKVFPKAIWPSTIPGMPPLSIRIIGDVNYYPYGPQTDRSDFNFPGEFTVLGAGAFDENFVFPWMVPYLRHENLCVKNVNNGDQARFIVGATMLLRANISVNWKEGFIRKTNLRKQPAAK